MSESLQSERTTVRRLPKRGFYDRETVRAIVDEALICHVGFVLEGERGPQPVVIPTIHWRVGDTLYFHGSQASRMLRSLRAGVQACVTITLLDGLVLARSAFHHSMNYRSVVVFGLAREVTEREERLHALETLVQHIVRGRTEVRPPSEPELKQTMVLAMALDEASAKIRTGSPIDDDEDYDLPVWAGVLPLSLVAQAPIGDSRLLPGIEVPAYLKAYKR